MTNLLVGLAILVGLFGTVVPILPGAFLVAGAIVVWAILTGGTTAWAVAIGAVAIIALGQLLKYLIPGKQLKASGVPNWVLFVGAIAGIVGFFVIPIVGLVVGFIVGVRHCGLVASWFWSSRLDPLQVIEDVASQTSRSGRLTCIER
ncbi:MAG: DUF456 domain-containing protein [Candidatus Nanopelagicales bacterium]|nr:DUF456 domain-containing protein [Candidatus Nanopelagicales bacterium]